VMIIESGKLLEIGEAENVIANHLLNMSGA
jgi:hypothetical protein